MAENTKIEWARHTANCWEGCSRAGEGCVNCYAAALSKRFGKELWDNKKDGTVAPRMFVKSPWGKFKKWQNEAAGDRAYHTVFVGSMMDIFEKSMPLVDATGDPMFDISEPAETSMQLETGDIRARFFNEVVPENPNLMFLLLTKRPSNILKMIPEDWKLLHVLPRNVMYGATIANNTDLKVVARHLGRVRAQSGHTFWSMEPLLEKPDVNILDRLTEEQKPDWVIVGGESGHNRREFDPHWARLIRDWCRENRIAFFMKQWDKAKEIPDDLRIRQFPYWHHFEGAPQW